MKKIKKCISILALFIYSISALGQEEAFPVFTYAISQTALDCENNKICYTISVKADKELYKGKGIYYDNATFRYYIDPEIFEKPENEDYTILIKEDRFFSYINTQDEIKTTNIGEKLGFNSEGAYNVKTTIQSQQQFARVKVGETPVAIMKICLTPKKPLNSSGENLCYPFIFDHNPKRENLGIIENSDGLATSFSSTPTKGNTNSGTTEAEQYLWKFNPDFKGYSSQAEGRGSIGSVPEGATCIPNICLKKCYTEPTKKGTALETFAGISTLDRNVDGSWVDNSKGGFLKLESKTLGFVPTRITTMQRDNIKKPEEGMVIWNTTTNCLEYYNGIKWVCSQPKCKKKNNQ